MPVIVSSAHMAHFGQRKLRAGVMPCTPAAHKLLQSRNWLGKGLCAGAGPAAPWLRTGCRIRARRERAVFALAAQWRARAAPRAVWEAARHKCMLYWRSGPTRSAPLGARNMAGFDAALEGLTETEFAQGAWLRPCEGCQDGVHKRAVGPDHPPESCPGGGARAALRMLCWDLRAAMRACAAGSRRASSG